MRAVAQRRVRVAARREGCPASFLLSVTAVRSCGVVSAVEQPEPSFMAWAQRSAAPEPLPRSPDCCASPSHTESILIVFCGKRYSWLSCWSNHSRFSIFCLFCIAATCSSTEFYLLRLRTVDLDEREEGQKGNSCWGECLFINDTNLVSLSFPSD